MSTAPHHRVYYALQQAISREVKVEAILPHLINKKVIQESDINRYKDPQPKKGTKLLLSYLRSRSYETFLDFIECILLAQRDAPIVDSIKVVVQEFDEQNNTNHAQRIADIQQKYMKQQVAEETETKIEEHLIEERETKSEDTSSNSEEASGK